MSFDDQIRAALDSTAGSLREHLEAHLRAFSQQAIRAAAEERHKAVQAATDAVRAEVRAHAEALVAEIRSQAEAQMAHIRAVAQKHAEEVRRAAEAQITELRKALEELRTDAQQQLDAAWAVAKGEVESAQAEVDRARAETNQVRTEAAATRADATAARAEAEAARIDANAARAEADAAHADAQAARAETQSVRAAMEETRAAVAADVEEKVAARAAWFVEAIRSIDKARGISTVLDRLVECAGHEAERAAMLVVKGERLTGWRLEGFAADAPAAKSINMTVEEAGIAGVVLQTGLPTSRLGDEDHGPALPPFAGHATGRHAVAVPVVVGGEVVAVLYADAPCVDGDTADAHWPETLDAIARHGSRVLESITVLKAAGLRVPDPLARGSHMAVPAAVQHA